MKFVSKHRQCLAGLSLMGMTLWFSPAAFAHALGAQGAAFAEGLAHPFLGLDHMLAMMAVGLWAAQQGGSALWRVPSTFLAAMAGSALLADPSLEATWLEPALGGSVLGLGLSVAFAMRLPGIAGLLAIALFASFHGYAHGLEMPQAASPVGYGLGFMSATAGLHLVGVLLGLRLRRFRFADRVGGMAIAAAGLLIAVA